MAQVTITWKAFGDRPESNRYISSATFQVNGILDTVQNNTLLEAIYTATNLKSELADFGYSPAEVQLWKTIESVLPENRTHTSLSVGDTIRIDRSYTAIANEDGPTYKIADIGFELAGA